MTTLGEQTGTESMLSDDDENGAESLLQDDYNHWGTCHSPEQKNLNARRRRKPNLRGR